MNWSFKLMVSHINNLCCHVWVQVLSNKLPPSCGFTHLLLVDLVVNTSSSSWASDVLLQSRVPSWHGRIIRVSVHLHGSIWLVERLIFAWRTMATLRSWATPVHLLHDTFLLPTDISWCVGLEAWLAKLSRKGRLQVINIDLPCRRVLDDTYQSSLQVLNVLPASEKSLKIIIETILRQS